MRSLTKFTWKVVEEQKRDSDPGYSKKVAAKPGTQVERLERLTMIQPTSCVLFVHTAGNPHSESVAFLMNLGELRMKKRRSRPQNSRK